MDQAGGVLGGRVAAGVCAARDELRAVVRGAVWQCSDDAVETTLGLLGEIEATASALRATLRGTPRRGRCARTPVPSSRWCNGPWPPGG